MGFHPEARLTVRASGTSARQRFRMPRKAWPSNDSTGLGAPLFFGTYEHLQGEGRLDISSSREDKVQLWQGKPGEKLAYARQPTLLKQRGATFRTTPA